ncbi:MAG: polysaccharide deacetylase family protein [Nanoarchaeota archaeon]
MNFSKIPILMYHEISAQDHPWCVSPDNFTQQMRWLKENGYKTISLTELQEGLEREGGGKVGGAEIGQNKETKKTAEKYVVLTFDDGRKGVYEQAFPLLRQLGYTATIYIVPSWVESGGESLAPAEERYSSFMSWEEIKELAKAGWEIGSHSFSHQNLSSPGWTLPEQERALQLAEAIIKEKTGLTTKHFAYPHGKYTDELAQLVAQRYSTAVTIDKGFDKEPGRYARQGILHSTTRAHFPRRLQKPTLSVCLIVKNEQEFLERCLSSIAPAADEIIIVDTGSTDNTKKIVQQFSEKFSPQISVKSFDFIWKDDFAAARNESLRQATKDWIYIIDGDEVLDGKDLDLLRQSLNNWEAAGYRQVTRNYSSDSTIKGWVPRQQDDPLRQNIPGWFPSVKVRLFQNTPAPSPGPKIRFAGAVHELVSEQQLEQDGGKVLTLPFPVHHYGALKANWREKSAERIALTAGKIASNPTDAKAHFELGVQYLATNQYALAEQAFQHSLWLEVHSEPLYNLAVAQQKQGKYGQAIQNYQQVLSLRPEHAEAYAGLGFCFHRQQQGIKAREHFQRAIMFNPLFVDAYINLGAVLEQQNLLAEASTVLQKALTIAPQQARAHYNLGVVWEQKGFIPQAIGSYKQALALNYPKAGLPERVQAMKRAWERAV